MVVVSSSLLLRAAVLSVAFIAASNVQAARADDADDESSGGGGYDDVGSTLPAEVTSSYQFNSSPEGAAVRLAPVSLPSSRDGTNAPLFRYSVRVRMEGLVPRDWDTYRMRFEMTVLASRALRSAPPKPVVVLLHPTQVLPLNPFTDFWDTCAYLASYDFLCVMSRERTGEFGSSSSRPVAFSLARRGIAMLRNVYYLGGLYENTEDSGGSMLFTPAPDAEATPAAGTTTSAVTAAERQPGQTIQTSRARRRGGSTTEDENSGEEEEEEELPNPLWGSVKRAGAAYGYSLGGNAAQDFAAIAQEEDNVKAIALAHTARTAVERAYRIRVPIITGTGTGDTITPPNGPLSIWDLYDKAFMPFYSVTIAGSTHVNSVCGNQCPAVVVPCCAGSSNMPKHMKWFNAFFQLYLNDRREYGPLFWDPDNRQIASARGVEYVRRRYAVLFCAYVLLCYF